MADYIETSVGKKKILIEVSDNKGHVGFGVSQTHEEKKKKADKAYGQAMDTIRLAAEGVLNTLSSMEEKPDHVKIDFAIKIDANDGAMLARADSRDAQLRVSLGWNHSGAGSSEETAPDTTEDEKPPEE